MAQVFIIGHTGKAKYVFRLLSLNHINHIVESDSSKQNTSHTW